MGAASVLGIDDDKPRSINWVVGVAMGVVAIVGWGCMASDYANFNHGNSPINDTSSDLWDRMTTDFSGNAFEQIPNFFAVVSHNWKQNRWLIFGFAAVEFLILGGGLWMKKLDRELWSPAKRKDRETRGK